MISVRYIYNLFPSCHLILMFIYAVALYGTYTQQKKNLRLEIRKVTQVIGFNVMQKYFVRGMRVDCEVLQIYNVKGLYNLCTFGEHCEPVSQQYIV